MSNILETKVTKDYFSVKQISNKIKFMLEENLGDVKIKGEISGLKIASSGHGYFNLKEDNDTIASVMWRFNVARSREFLQEGHEVIARGKITAYGGQSKYQIIVESVTLDGVGAFLKMLKERKEKLAALGLFDKEHKKRIPLLSERIGIITSETGSVIKDIIHRINDRCPTHILLYPVSVQGESSAKEVIKAVKYFNAQDGDEKPDVIIIARGGGSIEDLWSFNDEELVKTVFNSDVPIISAIGHETDFTLLDYVADLRAPTPTAAAEIATPVLRDLIYTIDQKHKKILIYFEKFLELQEQKITNIYSNLKYIAGGLAHKMQLVDNLDLLLDNKIQQFIQNKYLMINRFVINKAASANLIQMRQLNLNNLYNSYKEKINFYFKSLSSKADLYSVKISNLDYNKILKLGYSIIEDEDGNFLSNSIEFENNNKRKFIRFHDKKISIC